MACASVLVHAFRARSQRQPIEWRNGKSQVTVSRARSPAATEALIAQRIAPLDHAANAKPPRSDKRPICKPLPARQVQRKRRTRIRDRRTGTDACPCSRAGSPARIAARILDRVDLHARAPWRCCRHQRRARSGAVVAGRPDDRPEPPGKNAEQEVPCTRARSANARSLAAR